MVLCPTPSDKTRMQSSVGQWIPLPSSYERCRMKGRTVYATLHKPAIIYRKGSCTSSLAATCNLKLNFKPALQRFYARRTTEFSDVVSCSLCFPRPDPGRNGTDGGFRQYWHNLVFGCTVHCPILAVLAACRSRGQASSYRGILTIDSPAR